jgi:hypothetical protein
MLYVQIWYAIVLFLCGMSAPETIVLAPLAVLAIFSRRSIAARLAPITFMVALIIQTVTFATNRVSGPRITARLDDLAFATVSAFDHRVVITSIAGAPLSSYLAQRSDQGLVLLVALAFTAVMTLAIRDIPGSRIRLSWLLATALAFIAIALDGRGLTPGFSTLGAIGLENAAERYFLLPTAALIIGVALSLDSLKQLTESARNLAFSAFFIWGSLANFALQPFEDMHWSAYAPAIDRWAAEKRNHVPSTGIIVPVNPPGWAFELPARS